ncbi:MAG: hypothetical protein E7161_01040 [Firmicutes bacterium]|nr:hypothetical protein [Bacillota bacterium]
MKDLPKVFANKISENINNTQDIFYGNDRSNHKKPDSLSIVRKINSIFASTSHVYKSKVKIELKDKTEEKVIVGKTTTHLITIDGELIKIIDIVDIEKI